MVYCTVLYIAQSFSLYQIRYRIYIFGNIYFVGLSQQFLPPVFLPPFHLLPEHFLTVPKITCLSLPILLFVECFVCFIDILASLSSYTSPICTSQNKLMQSQINQVHVMCKLMSVSLKNTEQDCTEFGKAAQPFTLKEQHKLGTDFQSMIQNLRNQKPQIPRLSKLNLCHHLLTLCHHSQ